MPYTKKSLPNSQVEFTITVEPTQYAPHLEKAAKRISDRVAIQGFRKGHVPFDMVKKQVGEMAILQEALESIISETYVNAVMAEKLDVIGSPKVDVDKVAPGNDLVYRATVAILPDITLPAIEKISVEKPVVSITDDQVKETIDALRGMNAVEVSKTGAAEGTDKLVIDLDMTRDNVPVEGGVAKNYQVYLGEDHYIPGFNDQVKGMKAGEEKKFTLDFPKTHYQKQLAGTTVDFSVKVKDVFERQFPELNEEFAKKLNMESVSQLQELIKSNMAKEAEQKAEQTLEAGLLDAVIEKTKFGEIPEVLIDSERQKMFYELKRDLDKHGVSIEQYLADIKKDEKVLFEDFKTQAEKRAKAALVSREIAKEHSLSAKDEAIDAEIETMKKAYASDKETQERLNRREVRDTIAVMIQNRNVVQWLKEHTTIG